MKENPGVYSISFRAFCENEFEWSKNIETGSHYSAKVNKYDHTAGGRLSLSFFHMHSANKLFETRMLYDISSWGIVVKDWGIKQIPSNGAGGGRLTVSTLVRMDRSERAGCSRFYYVHVTTYWVLVSLSLFAIQKNYMIQSVCELNMKARLV